MLQTNLLSLPTDLSAASTPDDTLYYYLCSNPSADPSTITHQANTLIRSLQPDETGSSKDPPAVAPSHLIPFLTNIKRVLTQPSLRAMTTVRLPVCMSYSKITCVAHCAPRVIQTVFLLNRDVARIPNYFCSSPAPEQISLVTSVSVLTSQLPFLVPAGDANFPDCEDAMSQGWSDYSGPGQKQESKLKPKKSENNNK